MSKKGLKKRAVPVAIGDYAALLAEIKSAFRTAQVHAGLASNAVMLRLYWEVGELLSERQNQAGWGAAVLPRLANDLANELPEAKGFSQRNMQAMIQFRREYPTLFSIAQQPVAQLAVTSSRRKNHNQDLVPKVTDTAAAIAQQAVAKLPWGHNLILIQKVKDLSTRLWYARQACEQGWSRDVLSLQIQSQAHERQGKAITNFASTLPPPQSDLAAQLLKDPYLFDFLTLEKPFHERELETDLLRHLQDFLVELGTGFAFVGRQVPLEVGDDDFYIDLLFYHLRLRCFVVIELKIGRFLPEHAGKMNFYLNTVDAQLKHATDQPSIGLILCEEKNKIVAEYALRGMDKAIGVSAYQLTRALPEKFRSALPSIEQLEEELSRPEPAKRGRAAKRKKTRS